MRRLHHVAAFPEDSTILHAVQNNSLCNNTISKRDIDACNDIMGRSKYTSQGKRTMRSSDPTNVNYQLIEFPPTMKKHYSNDA